MKFGIDKKQFVPMLLFTILPLVAGISFVLYFFPHSASRSICIFALVAGFPMFGGRVISELKTWVAFDEKGVSAFRYGQNYAFAWDQIHRIEFKQAKWFPPLRMVTIHGYYGQKVHIDFGMENYKEIYKVLLEHVEKYAPKNTPVDKDLYEFVEKYVEKQKDR